MVPCLHIAGGLYRRSMHIGRFSVVLVLPSSSDVPLPFVLPCPSSPALLSSDSPPVSSLFPILFFLSMAVFLVLFFLCSFHAMCLRFVFSVSFPFLEVFLSLLIFFHVAICLASLAFLRVPLLPLFGVVWHRAPPSSIGSIFLTLSFFDYFGIASSHCEYSFAYSFFQHLYCAFVSPAFSAALSRICSIPPRDMSTFTCPVSLSSTSIIFFGSCPRICIVLRGWNLGRSRLVSRTGIFPC